MHRFKTLLAVASLLAASLALAGPVNINSADAQTIAGELKGIGLSKAEAIVAYREANGPFTSIAELAQVKGIGVRTLEMNAGNILLAEGS